MNKIRTLCASAALLSSSIGFAGAEENATNAFLGNWVSSCNAWGVAAYCSSKWSRGLHATHLVQEYKIVREDDGTQVFLGRGVFARF